MLVKTNKEANRHINVNYYTNRFKQFLLLQDMGKKF